VSPTSGDKHKIPLRLVVLTLVALVAAVVVGGLTWLSAGEVSAAVLSGVVAGAMTFAWLVENVA